MIDSKTHATIPVLDGLRAFAALSVCLYHFVCTTTGYITTEWILNLFSFGRCGVQLFFVISGFVIPWAMQRAGYRLRNFFSFLVKRLARLEPPYVVSLLLAITILFLRGRMLGHSDAVQPLTLMRVALHFGYLVPFFDAYQWINQVYWTLAVEFQYYLFIALVFIPITRWGRIARFSCYAGFLILGLSDNRDLLPYWLPVFLLGILLFLTKSKLIRAGEYYLVTALVFAYCVFRYSPGEVVFMAVAIAAILYFPNSKSPVTDFFGKISYSLYLTHSIIGATLINVLSHHVSHPAGKLAVIVAGVLVTVFVSWLMYRFVEKPSKKLSSSISYQPVSSQESPSGLKPKA